MIEIEANRVGNCGSVFMPESGVYLHLNVLFRFQAFTGAYFLFYLNNFNLFFTLFYFLFFYYAIYRNLRYQLITINQFKL
jgi:hypothetical protein